MSIVLVDFESSRGLVKPPVPGSIAACLGQSAGFDHAVAEFAETYADLNELDHAALADAVKSGTVEARTGL